MTRPLRRLPAPQPILPMAGFLLDRGTADAALPPGRTAGGGVGTFRTRAESVRPYLVAGLSVRASHTALGLRSLPSARRPSMTGDRGVLPFDLAFGRRELAADFYGRPILNFDGSWAAKPSDPPSLIKLR